MIEGASSRTYIETKKLMYGSGASLPPNDRHPERSVSEVEGPRDRPSHLDRFDLSATDPRANAAWPILMDKLVTVLAEFAAQQVSAGADVIQVFDSWAGALSVADYRAYVLAPTTELIRRIQALGVPVIYFGVDTASLLPHLPRNRRRCGGIRSGASRSTRAGRAVGHNTAIQGNLDPITLFAPAEVLEARVREILSLAAGRPGHIFNLGHGIVPNTPVDSVLRVVDLIKRHDRIPLPAHPTKPPATGPSARELGDEELGKLENL